MPSNISKNKGRGFKNPVLRYNQVDDKITQGLGEGFLSYHSSFVYLFYTLPVTEGGVKCNLVDII